MPRLRQATVPSDPAGDPHQDPNVMAAQGPLGTALAHLTAQVERLTAQIERFTIENERLSREAQQLKGDVRQRDRTIEQLQAAARSAGMTAQRNAYANSAAANANFPWYLPLLQLGCHEQAAFAHGAFGI